MISVLNTFNVLAVIAIQTFSFETSKLFKRMSALWRRILALGPSSSNSCTGLFANFIQPYEFLLIINAFIGPELGVRVVRKNKKNKKNKKRKRLTVSHSREYLTRNTFRYFFSNISFILANKPQKSEKKVDIFLPSSDEDISHSTLDNS